MSKKQKVKFNQHKFFQIFLKTLFGIFLQFLMHFLIPSGTNVIINMESVSEKKSNKLSVSLQKCQQEAITQYWLKLVESAPNIVRSSQN